MLQTKATEFKKKMMLYLKIQYLKEKKLQRRVRDHLFVVISDTTSFGAISFDRHRLTWISNKTCFNCRRNRFDTQTYV